MADTSTVAMEINTGTLQVVTVYIISYTALLSLPSSPPLLPPPHPLSPPHPRRPPNPPPLHPIGWWWGGGGVFHCRYLSSFLKRPPHESRHKPERNHPVVDYTIPRSWTATWNPPIHPTRPHRPSLVLYTGG